MPSGSHVQLAALRNRDLELQTTSPFSNHGSVERSTACFRRKNVLVLLGFQKFPLFCVILYIFCHCILVRNLSAIWREVQQYAQAVFRPARTSVPTQQADGPSVMSDANKHLFQPPVYHGNTSVKLSANKPTHAPCSYFAILRSTMNVGLPL